MAKTRSTRKRQKIDIGWYEDLLQISPVGIFFTDAEGNCLHVNQTWCLIAGLSTEQALGRGWLEAIHPDAKGPLFHLHHVEACPGHRIRSSPGAVGILLACQPGQAVYDSLLNFVIRCCLCWHCCEKQDR